MLIEKNKSGRVEESCWDGVKFINTNKKGEEVSITILLTIAEYLNYDIDYI